MFQNRITSFAILAVLLIVSSSSAEPWKRHIVDDTSEGADGVRLADVNGDGLQDVCTGWEQGGVIRVYLNPGPEKSKQPWPKVTVGHVQTPEDAVFCDLDSDGQQDVVSCCEQTTRTVYLHWAPKNSSDYMKDSAWKTEAVPCAANTQKWMYCVPMQVDGLRGIDLVVGSKQKGATIGWLESPENPRDAGAWKFHQLSTAGWIMSLEAVDMDSDGDLDILTSDRFGKLAGVRWIENPGAKAAASGAEWKNHSIGGRGRTVMFLTVADLSGDGVDDVITTTRSGRLLYFERKGKNSNDWIKHRIANPFGVKWGKAVVVHDVNVDGKLDLIHLSNLSKSPGLPAAAWMELGDITQTDIPAKHHDLGGPKGYKYDRIEMLDLDGDGNLDLLTCEEHDNLGVIWFENPEK